MELIFSYSTMFKVSPPPVGGSQKSHNIKCLFLRLSDWLSGRNGYNPKNMIRVFECIESFFTDIATITGRDTAISPLWSAKEWWAVSINNCSWSSPIINGVRPSPHPYLIMWHRLFHNSVHQHILRWSYGSSTVKYISWSFGHFPLNYLNHIVIRMQWYGKIIH